jgi:hypothetical protein
MDEEKKLYTYETDSFSYFTLISGDSVVDLFEVKLGIGKNYISKNGQIIEIDQSPIIINKRTLVPLRVIAESLGANVSWIASERKVEIIDGDKTLKLYVGQTNEELDVPAQIRNGRTLVPIRYVSESLNATVNWSNEDKEIIITK